MNKAIINKNWSNKVSIKPSHISLMSGALMGILPGILCADIGVTGLVEYLDNPVRSDISPDENDYRQELTVDGNLVRETERFALGLDYRASKIDYKDDLQDDRTILTGSAELVWKISPNVLDWFIRNQRSDMVIDWTLPDIDDNRQVVGVTSTGPRLTLPLGDANMLSGQAEFTTSDYEDTGFFDQDKQLLALNFTRQLSGNVSASINASAIEVSFPGEVSVLDYDLTNYSLLVGFEFENFSLAIEGGEYELERKGTEGTTSPLVQVSASYLLNSRSSLEANYGKSVVDIVGDLQNTFIDPVNNIVEQEMLLASIGSSNSANVYFQEGYTVGYRFQDPDRFSFALSLVSEERDYSFSQQFETQDYIVSSLSVPITPNFDLELQASVSEGEFTIQTAPQDRKEFRARGTYRISGSLTASIWYADLEQSSDTTGFDYEDYNVGISLMYRR